jgi:lysophospholipase L1-like esterase
LRAESHPNLKTSIYTFGGFPVTRISKHLKPRCLDVQPDIVVLQFASSDLVVPIHPHHPSNLVHRDVPVQSPKMVDWCRWQMQGFIGDLRGLHPITPLETYLQTMEKIVRSLKEHQIIPVALSPFIFGSRRSDRLARAAAGRLQAMLAALPGAVYVDAYSALNSHPRRKMLLKDGTHLSLAGHQVVAEVLAPCLKTLVAMAA